MASGEPLASVAGGGSESVDRTLAALIAGPSVQAGEGVRRLVVNSSALTSLHGVHASPRGAEFSAEISRRGGVALSALTKLSTALAATDVAGWSQWPSGEQEPRPCEPGRPVQVNPTASQTGGTTGRVFASEK